MKPEEKFDRQVLYVLEEIKRRSLYAKKGKPTLYTVNHNVIVSDYKIPSSKNEVSILEKLEEEWHVIKIRKKETAPDEYYVVEERFYLEILQPKFNKIYRKYQNKVDKIVTKAKIPTKAKADKIDSIELFRKQLKKLIEESEFIIGQRIEVEKDLKIPLKEMGVTDNSLLNALRYSIQKGYVAPYTNRPDDLTDIKITAAGYYWAVKEKTSKGKEVLEGRKIDIHKKEIKYDVFICHASEDKAFVQPLAQALKNAGIKVWYDDFVLKWGDDLRGSIDAGLVNSKHGIVIFSKSFLKKKQWTEHELNGLFAKEKDGKKVILPIWHDISRDDLVDYSPAFADRLAKRSDKDSIEEIVIGVKERLGR